MRKSLVLALFWIFCAPAFGQEARESVRENTPECAEVAGDFETLVKDFVSSWSGVTDFCEFKKFTVLNEMILKDMQFHAAQYAARMNFLQTLKTEQPDAVNFLIISFQESWFNAYIDSILLREEGRSSPWARWLTMGAAGAAVGLLALPLTKKHSTKVLRFFKTGLRHFLQKRAITFGSTSISQQAEHLIPELEKSAPKDFVQPPLYFGGDDDIMDQRTYNLFLNEIQSDVISAGAGVFGGWALGHGSSVVVRDRVAASWADTALGRYNWSQNKIVKFASPGMITGFAVTFYATNKIAEMTSDYQFYKRFRQMRSTVDRDLSTLKDAIRKTRSSNANERHRAEFTIYTQASKLKNDLALYNFILTRGLSEELASMVEAAHESLLHSFKFCAIPRDVQIKAAKKRFIKGTAKISKEFSREVQAALVLAQSAQEILTAYPHAMTASLTGINHKLMMRTSWMLNPGLAASDMWEDLSKKTVNQSVPCIDMEFGAPL